MPVRRRSQATPGPRRSPRTPARYLPAMHQAHAVLTAQQQAIEDLQTSLAAATLRGPTPVPLGVTTSAAPEKCEVDMTTSAFRSWRRSMTSWLQICRWPQQEAVLHIRLHCVLDLQRALDARFTDSQWGALTTEEAMDAIEKLVLRASNRAAQWSEFFTAMQGLNEPISEFFLRCNQRAIDCSFHCPNCSFDLTEYMLLRKLMVGLSDTKLRRHVFQSCDKITNVDALRTTCSAFQAARQSLDSDSRPPTQMHAAGTHKDQPSGCVEYEDQPDVAVARMQQGDGKMCGNCRGRHPNRKSYCPTRSLSCHASFPISYG